MPAILVPVTKNTICGPVGPDYHNSYEKHYLNAAIAALVQEPARVLTGLALKSMSFYGYGLVEQKRMGFGDASILTEHVQTMISCDVPLEHDKDEATPLVAAKILRHLGLDSLMEISNVSLNPDQPGTQAGVGPRPQMHRQVEIIDDMTRPLPEARAIFRAWREVNPKMLPGLWSTTCNIDDKYKPNTLEYHLACMEADIKYYNTACLQLDVAVFWRALHIGFERAQSPLPSEYLQALDA